MGIEPFFVPSRTLRYQWCTFCNLAGHAKPTIDHDVFLKDDNIGIAHPTIFDDPRVPISVLYGYSSKLLTVVWTGPILDQFLGSMGSKNASMA
jgi:hypothetical protein